MQQPTIKADSMKGYYDELNRVAVAEAPNSPGEHGAAKLAHALKWIAALADAHPEQYAAPVPNAVVFETLPGEVERAVALFNQPHMCARLGFDLDGYTYHVELTKMIPSAPYEEQDLVVGSTTTTYACDTLEGVVLFALHLKPSPVLHTVAVEVVEAMCEGVLYGQDSVKAYDADTSAVDLSVAAAYYLALDAAQQYGLARVLPYLESALCAARGQKHTGRASLLAVVALRERAFCTDTLDFAFEE